MKRILAITLTLVMLLAALTGCMASQDDNDSEILKDSPNSNTTQNSLIREKTINNITVTSLPSGYEYSLTGDDVNAIVDYFSNLHLISDFEENPDEYNGMTLVVSIEYHNGTSSTIYHFGNKFVRVDDGPWYKMDYEEASRFHPLLQELCSSTAGDNSSQGNEYLVSHIQIKSGNDTIYPFGCMTWSKIDNGNGTFSESIVDKYDVIDLVSGKTTFSATDIPKLVLSEKVSYFVQVNGHVEKVYLLTPNEDGYTKSETTFDALSNLENGTYYVAFNVLLSGNCDPDAPQNSYRYEDVFCLVVGEDNEPVNITYSSGDVLSQRILNNAEKQIILNILDSDNEWISDIPECDWICRFSGSVNVGYCDCGTLTDIGNNRSRKLTGAEKENIESLISQLNEEQLPSGYEVEVELFQYTWDGWGISQKTVGACDVAYSIIDALKAMKETGETVPKISDEVFEIGGGQYAAERGTMWIESGNKIYRLTPDLSQICLVETHFGEGKVLEITDAFKTNVNNAWHYAPYDYYKGTYNKGDYTVDLESVFKSGSTVQLSIKKIQIESGNDPNNTITVELISSVDQEVNIKLHCQQSDDNLAAGDYRTVQLKKGEPTTVDLTFGGWPNFTYWVYIEADYTKAEITINP